MFIFKKKSTFNWKSKKSYLNILKAVIYLIYNEDYLINLYRNKKLCIIIFEFNHQNNVYIPIANPIFISYNKSYTDIDLFNIIKWTRFAFLNNNNDNEIRIIIKISN